MPREDRRIIFEYEELYKAIYSLCSQKGHSKPPVGAVTMITENENDSSRIYILIENKNEQKSTKQEYSRDFIAAALMVYCRGCGIPLPKKARKSVVLKGEGIILRVEI